MPKAKTTKNLIQILSAIISVVFAFIIGVTYCTSVIKLKYGTNLKSTEAYLANQQYVVVNDVEQSPIAYLPGVHAVNISLQYAIDYDFDLRIKYSLDWLGDDENNQLPTENVELIFANRDNVIVDEEYVYYINYKKDNSGNNIAPAGLSAGSGELSLIAGVEIVENRNLDYAYKSLKIVIDEVKIYKAQSNYTESHPLYNGLTHTIVTKNAVENSLPDGKETVYRESAKAWLAHKQSVTSGLDDAYVMVYNHRYNTENGISSPGHDSAYSRTIIDSVTTASWLGGNRAFVGASVYIITGSKPLAIKAKVYGTWRNTSGTEIQQYDSNIRFNYSIDWVNPVYEDNNLFETRDYNYIVPAYTACYIELVESVEITTVGGDIETANIDTYKLVVNRIEINGSVDSTFSYDGKSYDSKITSALVECTDIPAQDTRETYKQKDYNVISSAKYHIGLYDYKADASVHEYNNNKIVLVNNTNLKQNVTISYDILLHASNGSIRQHYDSVDGDGNTIGLRADSFDDAAYFREDKSVVAEVASGAKITYSLPGVNSVKVYTIAPNSSIQLDSVYSLGINFQSYLEGKYGTRDVWVEIVANINYLASTTTSVETSDLLVEMGLSGNAGTIKVKNISNDVVTAISVNLTLKNYQYTVSNSVLESSTAPNDWQATFWKYYTKDAQGNPTQNESKVWQQGKLYQAFDSRTDVALTEYGGTTNYSGTYSCVNKTVNLKPNESVTLLTFTYSNSNNKNLISSTLELNATAFATSAEALTKQENGGLKYKAYFVTKGVSNDYIVNNSQTSCIVRFTDSNESLSLTNVVKDGGYYYYTMIVRPGQILPTSSTIQSVEILTVNATFSVDQLADGWGTKTDDGNGNVTYGEFLTAMNNIFS